MTKKMLMGKIGKKLRTVRPLLGVYFLFNKGHLVYVGQSKNIHARVSNHIGNEKKVFDKAFYFECATTDEALELEDKYINEFTPKYNHIPMSYLPQFTRYVDLDKKTLEYLIKKHMDNPEPKSKSLMRWLHSMYGFRYIHNLVSLIKVKSLT